MASGEYSGENGGSKGSMWDLDQKLDQPMDEEAGRIKNMYREKKFSAILLLRLAFQSLGVVYGDLGTSPLYVFYNTFPDGINDTEDVIGALSLIIYSLTLIPLLKYVFIVCRANDNGQVDARGNNGFVLGMIVVVLMFVVVHVYVTALWHLASVVSVLEPVYGVAAMKKSYKLLKGKTWMAVVMVSGYLVMCAAINGVFGGFVVYGESLGVFEKVVVGGVLVGVLVIVNLVALLVQSVFYYVCKSYHHEGIDKSALYDHLGGYLGEYVPLKSSIQMENLDV